MDLFFSTRPSLGTKVPTTIYGKKYNPLCNRVLYAQFLRAECDKRYLDNSNQNKKINWDSISTIASVLSVSKWITAAGVCSAAQSCPALCEPMDCSLPGSSVHGIFQARILEWVAISWYYFLIMLQCLKSVLVTQSCPTHCDPMDCTLPGSLCPWNSSDKNTEVGGHSLLQVISTKGSNPGLLHYRQILSPY